MHTMTTRVAALGSFLLILLGTSDALAGPDAPVSGTPLREESPYSPWAGVEVGAGVVWPSLGAPLFNIGGHLGGSLSVGSNVTLALGIESGVGLALSGATPTYGYMLRVPLRGFFETIISRPIDYRTHRAMNLHIGGGLGSDFVLASECSNGSCSYLPPGSYLGFGLRVGLSVTQDSNGIGAFLRWDNDVSGTCAGGTNDCHSYIQMFTWNVGWTLF
jgi:hypothetical protein